MPSLNLLLPRKLLGWVSGVVDRIRSSLLPGFQGDTAKSGVEHKRKKNQGPALMYVADTEAQVEHALSKVKSGGRKFGIHVIGMDCEKCADDQGGADFTCVLQLASHDNGGYAAVIRLKDLQPLPAQLIALLEDENIWKVGVAIEPDARNLENKYNKAFKVRGTLDLGWLGETLNIPEKGLKPLAKKYLGVKNWTSPANAKKHYNLAEIPWTCMVYAASDAYYGVELFLHMFDQIISQEKTAGKKWDNLPPKVQPAVFNWFKTKFADKFNKMYPYPRN